MRGCEEEKGKGEKTPLTYNLMFLILNFLSSLISSMGFTDIFDVICNNIFKSATKSPSHKIGKTVCNEI